MKCHMHVALLFTLTSQLAAEAPESPIVKVITFIEDLKKELTEDMAKETASFEKYDSWCTETIATATTDITDGEAVLESTKQRIEEITGTEAASEEEIANAQKQIVKNGERIAEANKVREAEAAENEATLKELSASITAMTEALSQLSAQNAATPTFLQSGGAVKTVQKLLKFKVVHDKMAYSKRQVLVAFASAPRKGAGQGFMQLQAGASAADNNDEVTKVIETTKNEFEKQRTALQNEDASQAKSHEELQETMAKETNDLETFLTEQKALKASKGKELSDKIILRDETEVQLKADKQLLTTTQDSCKEKAYRYKDRKKDRDAEMAGVNKALEILSSGNATTTFDDAAAISFMQTQESKGQRQTASSVNEHRRQQAYELLQASASENHNIRLARIAVEVKTAREEAPDDSEWGVFTKVIKTVDKRIENLREEEEMDVKHKDRCTKAIAASAASLATLEDQIGKASTKIERIESAVQQHEDDLAKTQEEMTAIERDMSDLEAQRKDERLAESKALKDDKDALVLLKDAMETISKFFDRKNVDIGQVDLQRIRAEPEKRPDAGFKSSEEYNGAKDSTSSLMQLMRIVKEEMEAEIEHDVAEKAKNEELFRKAFAALKELHETQEAKKITSSKVLTEKQEELQAKTEFKDAKIDEKASEDEEKVNLMADCAWVKTSFESRKKKRFAEIQSLVEAKSILGGLPEP